MAGYSHMRFIPIGVEADEDAIRFGEEGDLFYISFRSFIVFTKDNKYLHCAASADRSFETYISGYLEDMARRLRSKAEGAERVELLRTVDAAEFSSSSQEALLLRELSLHMGQYSSAYPPNVLYKRTVYTSAGNRFEVALSPTELRRRSSVGSAAHYLYAVEERRKVISSSISYEQQPMLLL
jgi:hypothetical protein